MNTIEQAREVAECLRVLTRNRNDGSAYPIAADTIDALIAELAAIKAQEPVATVSEVDTDDGTVYAVIDLHSLVTCGDKLYLAAGAQSIPSGYQLVPVEPTPAMVEAAYHGRYEGGHPSALYQNMLAAAWEQAAAQEQRKPPTALSSK